MALFESGNPTLSEKIFNSSLTVSNEGTMTARGAIKKFGFLLLMVFAGAFYTWNLYLHFKMPTMMIYFWVGTIGGLITAIVISFKPTLAPYLSPGYALLEGFVVGTFSAIVDNMVKNKYPNIVMQAVLLTFGVAVAVFLLYNFRIIKPTQKFKAIIISASLGVVLLYVVYWILGAFNINVPFLNWGDTSLLGIGINIFIIIIAALSLILDFERIETGEQMGAPKYMEWYGAFGLLVTMVWLYIQILKLLSRFASSRN